MEVIGQKLMIGGKERVIALDLNALISYAKITGQEIQTGLAVLENRTIGLMEKFEKIRLLLYAALVSFEKWNPDNLAEDLLTVGNWIQPSNMFEVMDAIMKNAGGSARSEEFPGQLAPFVPSPPAVVEAVLSLAELRDNDVFVDLGAGDGRFLIAAAEVNPTVKAIGYEASLERYSGIKALVRERKLGNRIAVRNSDIMTTAGDDIAEATVIYMYLLQGTTNQVIQAFKERIQPGTRIITHDFTIDSMKPEKTLTVTTENGNPHLIQSYLYTGEAKEAEAAA